MTLLDFKASRGLSLTGLALLLGRPISTVQGWLDGTRRPDVELLQAISEATEGAVSPADLRPDLAAILRSAPAQTVAA